MMTFRSLGATPSVPTPSSLDLNRMNLETGNRNSICGPNKSPYQWTRGRPANIENWLRVGQPGFNSRQGEGLFFFATTSRPAPESIQPPTQRLQGSLTRAGKVAAARSWPLTTV